MGTRKDQILLAARDVFLSEGVARMSMRRVAARVGISATAIYRHYEDKNALLAAVVKEGHRSLGRYLFAALEGSDPRERLRRTGEQYLRFALENQEYYRVIFMSWDQLSIEHHTESEHPGVPPVFQFVIDRVRECIEAGLLPADDDDFETALSLWALCHGYAAFYISGAARAQMSLEAFRDLCIRQVTRVLDDRLAAARAR